MTNKSKGVVPNTLDLSGFCCDGSSRYDLATPVLDGSLVFATDGCILVWADPKFVPGARTPDQLRGRWPDVWSVRTSLEANAGIWKPIALPECLLCASTGWARRLCSGCKGGCVYPDAPDLDCLQCDGDGVILEYCARAKCPPHVEIDKKAFAVHYVRLVNTLPGAMWAGRCDGDKVRFMFNHGGGALVRLLQSEELKDETTDLSS